MSKFKYIIKKVFSNSTILYVGSRYGTYVIHFINSLFIAVYLGPYYLGIWGFINLVIDYVSQLNFGIPNSVNVIVSVNKHDEVYSKKIIANGSVMLLILLLLITIFFGISLLEGVQIGEKYKFKEFIVPVLIISILTHTNAYLSNIFRIYGQVLSIAFYQSIYPILLLLVIPFFKEMELLWAMIIIKCLSFSISLIYFLIKTPIKITLQFEFDTIKFIQKKGWHLFVYNTSFYLILLTTKAFISSNYAVEEFGYFTFSYSLANAVLLLLSSISFLVFPKMLNRFSTSSNEESQRILNLVRVAYISLSHFLIHAIILIFPLFIYFFPQYQMATDVFRMTALTVALYTNSFGYQGLLMARNKEKVLGRTALLALFLNVLLCFMLVYIVKAPFSMIIFATTITYFIYVFALAILGINTMNIENNFIAIIKDVFPFRMMFPFALSILLIVFQLSNIFFIFPFFVYLLINIKEFRVIRNVVLMIIKNPNFINI